MVMPEDQTLAAGVALGYREFSGLATSILAGDTAEAEASLVKLRNGSLRHTFNPE